MFIRYLLATLCAMLITACSKQVVVPTPQLPSAEDVAAINQASRAELAEQV